MDQQKFSNKKLIEKYLNNINISEKYNENYKTFINLILFLETIDNLDIDDIFIIDIIENGKIQDLIKSIVIYDKDEIKDNKINEIYSNDIGYKLIDTYCILNDLNIKDIISLPCDNNCNEDEEDTSLTYDNNVYNIYLKSISNIPVLDLKTEKKLFQDYFNGDEDARTILINSNLKLVVNIAKKYINRGMDIMDLTQDGNNRLIDIIKKFNLKQNIKFSTFAYICIKRYMERSLALNSRNIRIPDYLYHDIQIYIAASTKLEIQLNREVTREDIAQELNWSKEKVEEIEKLQFDTYSLSTIIIDGDHQKDIELEDIIPSDNIGLDEVYEKKVLQDDFRKLLLTCKLSKRELFIIQNRLKDLTFEEIAKEVGVTPERVRQITKKIKEKIIKNKKTDKLAVYMDNEEEALKNLEEKRKQLKKERKKNKK